MRRGGATGQLSALSLISSSIARYCGPARPLLKSPVARIAGSQFAESLGGDGVQQPRHGLIRPVFGVALDLRVAACARGGVDAAALTEVVPEGLDLVGADVVSAAPLFFGHFISPNRRHRPSAASRPVAAFPCAATIRTGTGRSARPLLRR